MLNVMRKELLKIWFDEYCDLFDRLCKSAPESQQFYRCFDCFDGFYSSLYFKKSHEYEFKAVAFVFDPEKKNFL